MKEGVHQVAEGPSGLASRVYRRRAILAALCGGLTLAASSRGQTCYDGCNFTNTFQGVDALLFATGADNTAFGYAALKSITGGYGNTAVGALALFENQAGIGNTAIGLGALTSYDGNDSTAVGVSALTFGGSGPNTAVGSHALYNNFDGAGNTATGFNALYHNIEGFYNTATGEGALYSGSGGERNTAVGYQALYFNGAGYIRAGNSNTAVGAFAILNNSRGDSNTAMGARALISNTDGYFNTAVGDNALSANQIGSYNIAIGSGSGSLLTTGSNNIEIGHEGNATDANTIRIGKKGVQTKTVIAGIRGTTVSGGIAVYVDANGRLGTATSSARFKTSVQPMGEKSSVILGLNPVSFRYRQEVDDSSIPQFGLLAEEVKKIAPDLVVCEDDGKPYTVRYEAVNAMLLNEFLKEHKKVSDLHMTVVQQQKEIQELRAALGEQTSAIGKVNEQLAASRPATRLVVNQEQR